MKNNDFSQTFCIRKKEEPRTRSYSCISSTLFPNFLLPEKKVSSYIAQNSTTYNLTYYQSENVAYISKGMRDSPVIRRCFPPRQEVSVVCSGRGAAKLSRSTSTRDRSMPRRSQAAVSTSLQQKREKNRCSCTLRVDLIIRCLFSEHNKIVNYNENWNLPEMKTFHIQYSY